MGGVRSHDKKRLNFFIERGNGDSFIEQLEKLQHFVLQEWIEKGNKVENLFNTQGGTIKGYEIMNMLRKGQVRKVEKGAVRERVLFMAEIFGVAA